MTLDQWKDTLKVAMEKTIHPPQHFSIYDLQIEPDTVFGRRYSTTSSTSTPKPTPATKFPNLPTAKEAAEMYRFTTEYLVHQHGYDHYEISSFAKTKSHRGRHNQLYWSGTTATEWLALGLGATSFMNGQLFTRPRGLTDYMDWVQKGCPVAVAVEMETATTTTPLDIATDLVLKRLRTSEGMSLQQFEQRFGGVALEAIRTGSALAEELGMAVIERNDILRLTDPEGFLYSNTILSTILVELERAMETEYSEKRC